MNKRLMVALVLVVAGILFIGVLTADDTKSTTLAVKGMTCGACETKVVQALVSIEGISKADLAKREKARAEARKQEKAEP